MDDNAVFDGCSATMLSGETAMEVEVYPIDHSQTMRRVVDMAYANMDTRAISVKMLTLAIVIVDAIVEILNGVAITKVIVVTRSGFAARMCLSIDNTADSCF